MFEFELPLSPRLVPPQGWAFNSQTWQRYAPAFGKGAICILCLDLVCWANSSHWHRSLLWPWTFRNLPRELRQSTPELILAEDPISARCWRTIFGQGLFNFLTLHAALRHARNKGNQLNWVWMPWPIPSTSWSASSLIVSSPASPQFVNTLTFTQGHATQQSQSLGPKGKKHWTSLHGPELHRHFDIESDSAGGTPHARDLKKQAWRAHDDKWQQGTGRAWAKL